MASSLPSASMSPQIINGVVEWYCNDSFTYVIQITLINPITQDRVMVQPDDQIQVSFYALVENWCTLLSQKEST